MSNFPTSLAFFRVFLERKGFWNMRTCLKALSKQIRCSSSMPQVFIGTLFGVWKVR